MRKLIFTSFFLFLTYLLTAQCTNTYQWPTQNVAASTFNDTVVISNSNYAGDYAIITDLQIGETYQFSSQFSGDYLTIRDVYDSSILFAHGSTPLTFTPSTVDQIALHINLSSPPCGAENINRITDVRCTSCPDVPPMVGIETTTPGATLDVNGEIRIGDSGRPPTAGTIRWNDSSSDFEGYNGERWISLTKSNQPGQWGTQPTSEMNEDQKLVASDGSEEDRFGFSVSISGDYAIIGAGLDDIGGNSSQGSAYIFSRTGSSWTQQAKLTSSDGAENDRFGSSVSISGDYAIIGAVLDDTGGNSNQGSAYIFSRTGSSWTQQAKLTASDGTEGDNFGSSVSLSGNYAIVGVKRDDIGGNSSQGSAYIFSRTGSSWTQQAKLTASDGGADDWFGSSVFISGDYAIIGAEVHDIGGNFDQGAAYVFARLGSSWSQQAKLTANDGDANDKFGSSVSLSGDYAIVGAYVDDVEGNSNQGSAYIFSRMGSSWIQQVKLTASDGTEFDRFGSSVSLSGDYAIVGAYFDVIGSSFDQGSAYIFSRTGSSWMQQVKLTVSDGTENDRFGRSVCISGDDVIVGGYLNDIGGNTNQGAAYIFSKK